MTNYIHWFADVLHFIIHVSLIITELISIKFENTLILLRIFFFLLIAVIHLFYSLNIGIFCPNIFVIILTVTTNCLSITNIL